MSVDDMLKNMECIAINLNEFSKIKDYNAEAMKTMSDIYIRSKDRRYIIDGKSIMGIFSLDLSKDILVYFDKKEKEFAKYLKTIEGHQ